MQYSQNRLFIIAGEGKSEVAYIQEFNMLFRELEMSARLHPVCIGTDFFSIVIAVIIRICEDNLKRTMVLSLTCLSSGESTRIAPFNL